MSTSLFNLTVMILNNLSGRAVREVHDFLPSEHWGREFELCLGRGPIFLFYLAVRILM